MNKYAEQSRQAQAANRRLHACERKKAFATEADAFQKGQRSYLCPHCGLWHRSGSFATFVAKLNKRAQQKR